MNFYRDSEVGVQRTDGRFQIPVQTLSDINELDLSDILSTLESQLDRFTNQGSGWSLLQITRCTIIIGRYRPLG